MKSIPGIIVLSFVLAIPVGGFVFGFYMCKDCGWNVLGRAFIGCVMAWLTTVTFGYPPKNGGGVGEPYNAWPYIIVAWAFIAVAMVWTRRNSDD